MNTSSRHRRILIIDGHPDRSSRRFLHALADAYRQGAASAGHSLSDIVVSELDFPLLRTTEDFEHGDPPRTIRACQELLKRADHVVILFPLWLGSMPALLKGFFEQLLRPGFAFDSAGGKGFPRKLLKGKSARVIVTMGMPGFFYRWFYRSHSLKSLERNILAFCGFTPVRSTVIGLIAAPGDKRRKQWLERLKKLGAAAE